MNCALIIFLILLLSIQNCVNAEEPNANTDLNADSNSKDLHFNMPLVIDERSGYIAFSTEIKYQGKVVSFDSLQGIVIIKDNDFYINGPVICKTDFNKLMITKDGQICVNGYIVPVRANDIITVQNTDCGHDIFLNGIKQKLIPYAQSSQIFPLNHMIESVSVPSYIAKVKVGSKSAIICDSSIASDVQFEVKDGDLRVFMSQKGKAYATYNGKAPCTVFAELLGLSLSAYNNSELTINKASKISALEAYENSNISGTISSLRNLKIDTASSGKVDIIDVSPSNLDIHAVQASQVKYSICPECSKNSEKATLLKISADQSSNVQINDNIERESTNLLARQNSSISAYNLKTNNLIADGDLKATLTLEGQADSVSLSLNESTYKAAKLKASLLKFISIWSSYMEISAKEMRMID